jgi:hypothetical protein
MMAELSQADFLRQADELYERYGVPLEAEHWESMRRSTPMLARYGGPSGCPPNGERGRQ